MSPITENFGILLLIVVPVILVFASYLLKTRILEENNSLRIINVILALPLLTALSLFIGFGSVLLWYPFEFGPVIEILSKMYTIVIAILLLIQLGLYIPSYSNYTSQYDEYHYSLALLLVIWSLILVLFISANLGISSSIFFTQVIIYILGLVLTILVIAAGIALSYPLKNYLSYRNLVNTGLQVDRELTVFTSPIISGTIARMDRQYVVIEQKEGHFYISPSGIDHHGFKIEPDVE